MIYAFLGIETASKALLDHLNLHFLPKRVKMGVHAKVLLGNDASLQDYPPYSSANQKFLTEYRIVNMDAIKFSNEINIYGGNKVAFMMFSDDEMSGLVIQSKKLHDTLKALFDLTWFVADT